MVARLKVSHMAVIAATLVMVSAPATAFANPCTWSTQSTPNVGNGNNSLLGISAVSATDALAVGAFAQSTGQPHGLILAFGGSLPSWKNVPVTTPGIASAFSGASPFSSNGAYIAGAYKTSSGAVLNYAGKLTGTTLTRLKAPNLGATQNALSGVLSLGSNSAIFIGYYIDTLGFYQNYAAIWNGTSFTNLMPPGQGGQYAGTNSEFTGISAVPGTNDIAVAGSRACPVNYVCPFVYVYHKLTGTWGPITTGVTPTTAGNYFLGIDAISSTMAWAVGWYQGPTSQAGLIEKFKDSTLTFVDETLPTLPANTNLSAVSAESATNALAVGGSGSSSTARPVAVYWNGTSWATASPSTTTVSAFLGVSNVPNTNTYFNVGTKLVSGIDKNLAMKAVCD